MYSNTKKSSNFPDPLASSEEKQGREYGLNYAKAIYNQWGKIDQQNSAYGNRRKTFEKNRRYANGTQDTAIYRSLLTSLDPNNGDGSMLNLDFTPVPILPKFVRIVVNKILSLNPYPNLEAVDPLSSSEKDMEKKKVEFSVKSKKALQGLKEGLGVEINGDPDSIPDTLEEAEIFMGTNVKASSEIAAQIATNLTLTWNDFNVSILRRCVNDLAVLGIAVVKETTILSTLKTDMLTLQISYSFTEDPNWDLVYVGQVKHIPIQELKRMAETSLQKSSIKP